jgi:hypothetical protein
MKSAKLGLRWRLAEALEGGADAEGAGAAVDGRSVSFVIRFLVGIFRRRLVNHGFADYVFSAGPGAEVEQFAAFAAERELVVCVRVGWPAANGAVEFHGLSGTRLTRMDLK